MKFWNKTNITTFWAIMTIYGLAVFFFITINYWADTYAFCADLLSDAIREIEGRIEAAFY